LIELAPSILSADFAHLADQVDRATAGGAAVIHVDIMDGHFVPNMTIGPVVVRSLRKATQLPLDCHLMIENPDQYIPDFADAGADWISVHQEACRHLNRSLHLIKGHDCRAGVVINPATPVETLSEVRRLADLRARHGYTYRIEIDGGVAMDTVGEIVRAGTEILVAGNAVFGKGDPKQNASALLEAAKSASLVKV